MVTSSNGHPAITDLLPFAWGFLDGVLSGNPLTLLPGLDWADIGAHFACISLGNDSPYLSAAIIRLFPKHLLWEAGQQCARCLELSAEGSVTDFLTHYPAKSFLSAWRTWGLWTLQRALISNIAACVSFFFKTEELLLNAILTFDVVSLQFLFWGQSF